MLTDNPVELERKLLITKKEALRLINEYEVGENKAEVVRIEQNYLFKENAVVQYDVDSNNWLVELKFGGSQELFKFKELRFPELAKELFEQNQGENLLELKCAARIRVKNSTPIFTFKKPIENGKGDHEFECEIQNEVSSSDLFKKFVKKDPYCVKKDRFVISRNGLNYEFDYFDNINLHKQWRVSNSNDLKDRDLCLLEIEFDNENDYEEFLPDFECIDVGGMNGFGNKGMAKELGDKSRLVKKNKKKTVKKRKKT